MKKLEETIPIDASWQLLVQRLKRDSSQKIQILSNKLKIPPRENATV